MGTTAWPAPYRLPLQPRELAETGLCARHPHPEWWVSSKPPEREAAAAVCAYCPALEPCRAWALRLPQADNGVYAGMDARERRQMRRAAQEPVSAPAADDGLPGAA